MSLGELPDTSSSELSQVLHLFRAVMESTVGAKFVKDPSGCYLYCNQAGAQLVGRSVDQIVGKNDIQLFGLDIARKIRAHDQRVMIGGIAETEVREFVICEAIRPFEVTTAPYRDSDGSVIGVISTLRDISRQMIAEANLLRQQTILERIAQAAPLHEVLNDLVAMIEDELPEVVGSFLLLDPDGMHLHVAAGGKLPPAYNAAIEGIAIGPQAGSCGTAVFRGEKVLVSDIATDPLWQDFRDLALSNGLRACWSIPILSRKDSQNPVLGTFAVYSTQVGLPGPRLDNLISRVEYLACIAIENAKTTQQLRSQQALLEETQALAHLGSFDWNMQTNRISWSDELYRIYGYAPQEIEISLETFLAHIHPDDIATVQNTIGEACQVGSGFSMEERVIRRDGSVRSLDSRGKVIRDDAGRPVRVIGACLDVTEHKQAEADLRASQRFVQAVAKASPLSVYVLDLKQTRIIYMKSRIAADLGYKLPEGQNLTWEESLGLMHPDDLVRIPNLLARWATVTDDRILESEFRLKDIDGQWRWFASRDTAFAHADDGSVSQVIGTIQDITERKRAEEAQRDSEARYRQLVELLPDAILINVDNRIAFCNLACVRLFGATDLHQILGKNPIELIQQDFQEFARSQFASIFERREPTPRVRQKIVRIDGREVPVFVAATPITDRGIEGMLVCLHDLTERERSLELLRSISESVNDAILTIDETGVIVSANPSTLRMFGYSMTEIMGNTIGLLMTEPFRSEHKTFVANFIRTGVAKVIGIGREFEACRKDGTVFPMELTVTEFQLDGKRHFTGVIRDITARKRLENQFQQSQKMEAIGRLAGGVAHDFNNLLTVINGYSNLVLSELPAKSDHRESLMAILEAGERAARLTQQLLAFSRKAIIEPEIIDLNSFIEKTAKMLSRIIEEDIAVTLSLDPKLLPIKAAPGQLEQLILNIAVNARDAMPDGGRLLIETQNLILQTPDLSISPDLTPGQFVQLAFSDTGHGMTDDIKSKIFEPFFTTKEVGKGTGLGLSVVHGVVTQARGSITVESTIGVGTTFNIFFPVELGIPVDPEPKTSPEPIRGHETILLVEDETAVRKIARIALEAQGYKILEACGGREAIQLSEQLPDKIDLLLTDVVMPEMGGQKLSEAVIRQRPEIRVLFMSGYADDAILVRGVTQARDHLLQKPFTAIGLAQKVRAVLDGPRRDPKS